MHAKQYRTSAQRKIGDLGGLHFVGSKQYSDFLAEPHIQEAGAARKSGQFGLHEKQSVQKEPNFGL